jgi:hypothetical protein
MITVLVSLLLALRCCFRARAALHIELLALRHQIHVLGHQHAEDFGKSAPPTGTRASLSRADANQRRTSVE